MRFLLAALLILSTARASDDSPAHLIARLASLDLDEKAQMQRESVEFDDASKDRIEIEFALVAAGNKAVPDLLTALGSENRHVRAISARLLGILGDASAVAKLEDAALHDGDPSVRICAVQSLADPSGRVCSEYGVADQLMVHSEWVSAPSVFVIDKKGNIAWSHRGRSYDDRPSAQDVLARVRAANGR